MFGISEYIKQFLDVLKVIKESRDTADIATKRMDNIASSLKKKGLQMSTPPTPRDGNCLFHALSHQICLQFNIPLDAIDQIY